MKEYTLAPKYTHTQLSTLIYLIFNEECEAEHLHEAAHLFSTDLPSLALKRLPYMSLSW